ncbi:MAG TPA: DinB family protein [Thermoanaerobaculia bacterium]|nr:DinB family protein [Thermoanaerobaculia bacterium]
MSIRALTVVFAAALTAAPLTAQYEKQPAAEPQAEQEVAPEPAAAPSGFLADVATDLERTGGRLADLAGAIPADKYSWRPGEGVRSVSEVLMHVVGANHGLPLMLGAAPSGALAEGGMQEVRGEMMRWEEEVTAKDEVIAKLKESFDYAVGAVRAMPEGSLDETVDFFGPRSRRSTVLILLTHAHEHLGQSIAYARSLGVVPPWSQPAEGEAPAEGR